MNSQEKEKVNHCVFVAVKVASGVFAASIERKGTATLTCTTLFRTAYSTSSLTECNPSFRMMLLRCVSAVLTLKLRWQATSFVDLPSASNWTTSRSRDVRPGRFKSFLLECELLLR